MFKYLCEKRLTKKAFAAVEKNDVNALLDCLQKGFDINTKLTRPFDPKSHTIFQETVLSRAMREKKWEFLKEVIEHFGGTANLVFFDYIKPPNQETMRYNVIIPNDTLLWEGIEEKSFESSPLHFCFYHLQKNDPFVSDTNHLKVDAYFGGPLWDADDKLRAFYRNCQAISDHATLCEALDGVASTKNTLKRRM